MNKNIFDSLRLEIEVRSALARSKLDITGIHHRNPLLGEAGNAKFSMVANFWIELT